MCALPFQAGGESSWKTECYDDLDWNTVLYATLRKVDIQRLVWNVDLEKVNENQLDWTPIQSTRFGHGGWKQKLDEYHPTKTEQELSYRKQIARKLHTQYVDGIYDNPVTLKSRLTVT